jgi:hypothetical protein
MVCTLGVRRNAKCFERLIKSASNIRLFVLLNETLERKQTTMTDSNNVQSFAVNAHMVSKVEFLQQVVDAFTNDFFNHMTEDDTQSPDSRIGMGETSQALADSFGMSKVDMDALLGFLLDGYPCLRSKQGRYGGFYRVSPSYIYAKPQDKASVLATKLAALKAAEAKSKARMLKLEAEQARLGLKK